MPPLEHLLIPELGDCWCGQNHHASPGPMPMIALLTILALGWALTHR